MMKMRKRRAIGLAGACISYFVGAGFATMQELVQYYASYGSSFPLIVLFTAAVYIYTNISFAANGNKLKLKRGGDIFGVYCGVLGEKFGRFASLFFDYFAVFFCFMTFIAMCGGAASTAAHQWGMHPGIGAAALTVLVIFTALFGFKGILNVLGRLGPVIIIMILTVASVTALSGFSELSAGLSAVDAGEYSKVMKQVGGGNPIASGISYSGAAILWFAVFVAEIGSKNRLDEAIAGVMLSALFIFGSAVICCLAIIAHIKLTAGANIPALVLARLISPIFAQAFALVIYAGIYTTAVPLLWTSVRKAANEGTVKYRALIVIGGIIGCLAASFVPYRQLIYLLYGINGYLGFILVVFMVIYDLKTRMSMKPIREKPLQ